MKKRTKVFVSTLLTLAILGGAAAIGVSCYGKTYERAADTACTILQITDVHLLNDEKKDAKALKTIRAMVETTKPAMIQANGSGADGWKRRERPLWTTRCLKPWLPSARPKAYLSGMTI